MYIRMRYEKASMIITSNQGFDERSKLFHDSVTVTANVGRLLHHGMVVNTKGNSYRLKGKLPAELG